MSRSIYEEITGQIVDALKRGVLPWIRPWGAWPLRPNGQRYTGTNSLILGLAADKLGYRSRYWLTKAQGKRFGARVLDGQKGTRVFRPVVAPLPSWAMDPGAGVLPPGARRVWTTSDGVSLRVRMEGYPVFNPEQFEGLPPRFYARPEREGPDLGRAVEFFRAIEAKIEHGGNEASYSPPEDLIQMPESASFDEEVGYFATLAHELGHWTGHETRLARDLVGRFGDPEYAEEELVAELASAYVLAVNDLPGIPHEHHAAYLDSWLEILENDPQAFPKAATLGQRAADYLTIAAAAPRVCELDARRLDEHDYVAIYFDRVEVGPNPILVAIGLDAAGFRVLLGVGLAAAGKEDGAEEARTLLQNLVRRGLSTKRPRLFVTSDTDTLGRAVRTVFGPTSFVQRCRSAVAREVVRHLRPESHSDGSPEQNDAPEANETTPLTRDAVRKRIRDAYGLGLVAGLQALHVLADQLEGQGARSAASALRASFADLFTMDWLGLWPPLDRSLSTTHAITQARFGLRRQICRPPTWRDGIMALQWGVASFRDTIEVRRRIAGHSQLHRLVARLESRKAPAWYRLSFLPGHLINGENVPGLASR